MRMLILLCVVFTLPVIGVLGHDVYMAAHSTHGIDLSQPFPFSDLGWLWLNYEPDSFRKVHDIVGHAFWRQRFDPVLEQKSIFVAAVPAVFFYVLFVFFRVMGSFINGRPGGRSGKNDKGRKDPFTTHAKGKPMQYKRR